MARKTQQRDALNEAFSKAARPVTVPEIHEIALSILPGLGIATVYREIKRLLEEGAISKVDIPGEPAPRYELQQHAHHHHHHFKCESCGKVYDIEGCALPAASLSLPKGFTHHSHEITIYGTCKNCA